MISKRFDVLLTNLLVRIGRRCLDAVARDLRSIISLSLFCGYSECRNCDPGVTANIVRDGLEFLIGNGVGN